MIRSTNWRHTGRFRMSQSLSSGAHSRDPLAHAATGLLADLMIVARGTDEEDRASAQCAAARTWSAALSGRPGHDRPGADLRFRKAAGLQMCSYRGQLLDADGRAGRCIWRAIPRAIKAHVVEGSIRRPAGRCPHDEKAAYDDNGSAKQDGIFAHVKFYAASVGTADVCPQCERINEVAQIERQLSSVARCRVSS